VHNVKQKILIVDDNQLNLSMLGDVLANGDYDLFFAKNGVEALSIVEDITPDMALLDIMMPVMDGFELLTRLREISSLQKMPVMFLTALDDGDMKIKAFEVGAVDYIAKPFNGKEVLARVRAHLGVAKFTRSLDFLLKMAAHEYRVPLAVINTSLQMQKMEYGDSEYLRAISSASATLQGVYKDISCFLTFGSKSLEFANINLGEFVASRVNYLRVLASAYDNDFVLETVDKECFVHMSETELERVVDNILSNAAKHAVQGSIVKIRIKATGDNVEMEVENDSKQIHDVKKLFEAFYRGDTRANGLGLGLYVALRICEQNDIKLTACSQKEQVFFNMFFKRVIA
jgi:two-component system, sensor histidine kinase and response regulator